MLIDTKQIIPKTHFRQNLNTLIDEVKKGKTFVVSDRGEIVAVVSSPEEFEFKKGSFKTELLEETVRLAIKIDKGKPRWESLTALKKAREERTEKLGNPFKL